MGIATAAILIIATVIWLCTKKGDAQWERETGTPAPAPEWARWLFVFICTGLVLFVLALCGIVGQVAQSYGTH